MSPPISSRFCRHHTVSITTTITDCPSCRWQHHYLLGDKSPSCPLFLHFGRPPLQPLSCCSSPWPSTPQLSISIGRHPYHAADCQRRHLFFFLALSHHVMCRLSSCVFCRTGLIQLRNRSVRSWPTTQLDRILIHAIFTLFSPVLGNSRFLMFLLVHSHVYNMFRTLWSVLLFICLLIYLYDIYLLFDSWFIICL